jgi:hypothetical protein
VSPDIRKKELEEICPGALEFGIESRRVEEIGLSGVALERFEPGSVESGVSRKEGDAVYELTPIFRTHLKKVGVSFL